jgi:hypothetical protein
MTPHQVKEGYMSLPPKAQREFVLWAVNREFSGEKFAGLETQQIESVQAALTHGKQSGGVSTALPPGLSTFLKTAVFILIAGVMLVAAGFLFLQYQNKAEHDAEVGAEQKAEQVAAAREAEQAARPSSPTNLEFLNERVGKEVTLRGIPVKAEVGYLYFHEDPAMGARVKLISGGVVVYQSTELEQWVENEQELEIRGTLIRNGDENLLEILVDRQIQIKLVEQP